MFPSPWLAPTKEEDCQYSNLLCLSGERLFQNLKMVENVHVVCIVRTLWVLPALPPNKDFVVSKWFFLDFLQY